MSIDIVPLTRTDDGELVVSSETIAEGSGVQHKNVLELILANAEDLAEFGTVAFQTRPLPGGGIPRRFALLNEQQATLLMTYQRNTEQVREFKKALVKSFFEMARTVAPALSDDEILHRALTISTGRVQALEAKVAEDAPKVEYVDMFVAGEDLMILRNVAKPLGVSEVQLRAALVEHHWIYQESTTRWSESEQRKVPYVRYSPYASHAAFFRTVQEHRAPRFKGEVMHTLKVTPQGAHAIARAVERWGLVRAAA